MKNLKSLLFATLLFLGASQVSNAQAKIAHVDVSEIMTKLPAMLEAQKQLDKLSQTYQADYKTMGDEYQAKLKKYDSEASTVTDALNAERQKEVADMEKRIQDFGQTAQKDFKADDLIEF